MNENDNFQPHAYVRRAELLPAPFDSHIASIKMWSDANLADEGYNVFVSADFGSEMISLKIGDEEIDVLFEIHQAEIKISVTGSEIELGRGYFEQFGNEPQGISPETSRSAESSNEIMVEISPSPVARVSKKWNSSEAEKTPAQNEKMQFSHPEIQLLRVGNWRNDKPLNGSQIANYLGWRVNPDATNISGVLARLNVRKNWIKFSHPTSVNTGKVGKILAKLSISTNRFDRLKAEMFPALLRDLVFLRLQRPNENKTATLAASGLIVEEGGYPTNIQSRESPNEINLPDHQLLRFLNCDPGTEANTHELIVAEETQFRKIDRSIFLPTAPYSSCLKAYLDIRILNSSRTTVFQRKKLVQSYGDKVVTALTALGFLIGKPDEVRLVEPFPTAIPTLAFEAVVKRQKIVRIADDYLINHPNASALELGRTLKATFGKNWSDGTCQRYGHEIRKWARLESPTLDRKGRPFSIGPQQEVLIEKIVREGGGTKDIVRVLIISTVTLGNWRKSEANTKFSRKGPWKILT
jgi:hypothetical protein